MINNSAESLTFGTTNNTQNIDKAKEQAIVKSWSKLKVTTYDESKEEQLYPKVYTSNKLRSRPELARKHQTILISIGKEEMRSGIWRSERLLEIDLLLYRTKRSLEKSQELLSSTWAKCWCGDWDSFHYREFVGWNQIDFHTTSAYPAPSILTPDTHVQLQPCIHTRLHIRVKTN